MNRREMGAAGERAAALYYQLRGYRVLARNFRTRQGEIDLVVGRGGMVVFVEVKTRGKDAIASPREWVDFAKQRRILLAARAYLAELGSEPCVRFDVMEVYAGSPVPKLHCIENAFEA